MKRVLLVDDQNDFLSLIHNRFAECFEIAIVRVNSGNEAIEIISSGEKFDLVVCDFHMPNGDGGTVFQFLLRTENPTPFILYTSCLDLPFFEGENFLGAVAKENMRGLVELAGQVIDHRVMPEEKSSLKSTVLLSERARMSRSL